MSEVNQDRHYSPAETDGYAYTYHPDRSNHRTNLTDESQSNSTLHHHHV